MKAPLGLDTLEQHLEEFISTGESYLRDARAGHSYRHCLHDPTFLKRSDSREPHILQDVCLSIDVGGTHTKAALVDFSVDTSGDWSILFDIKNEVFLSRDATEPPIVTFAENLARHVRDSLQSRSYTPSRIRSIAIVWSNQLQARSFESSSARGVTGLIMGISAGSYRKDEWFVKDLQDGFDLGDLFRSSLGAHGLRSEVFIIGNDTAFTLTALPGARGGVVASSGGNCTDVGMGDRDLDLIFNTEIGGLYKVAPALLSDGDRALVAQSGATIALEDLLSGKWLPKIFEHHISVAAARGVTDLRAISDTIRNQSEIFTTHDLCALLAQRELSPVRAGLKGCSSDACEALSEIAVAVTRRAGIAAACLCYFSIYNQIVSGIKSFSIALDSAMARHVPGYFEVLDRTFQSILEKRQVKGHITLMRPVQCGDGHEISVPLLGATFAGALWK